METLLRRCISVRISLVISGSSSPQDEGYKEVLAFRKGRGNWCLAIEEHRNGDLREWKPLGSCARDVRARVFADGSIETLIRDASRSLDEDIKTRSSAVDVIESLVTLLPELPDAPTTSKEASDDDIPF